MHRTVLTMVALVWLAGCSHHGGTCRVPEGVSVEGVRAAGWKLEVLDGYGVITEPGATGERAVVYRRADGVGHVTGSFECSCWDSETSGAGCQLVVRGPTMTCNRDTCQDCMMTVIFPSLHREIQLP